MEQNNFDKVFYIDSDVMLFSDVNKEWSKFDQFEMTLLHRTAAISSFITYKAINNFCNFLTNIFDDKNSYAFKKIESHFKIRQQHGLAGGVCDMTFLDYFHYDHLIGGGPGRIGEMMIIINDSTYDHNINAEDQDYLFENGIKKIEIFNKTPFIFNKKLNKYIKFNSIHFQGNAKNLIKSIYEQCN